MNPTRERRSPAERTFWGLAFGAVAVQIVVLGVLIGNSYFVAEDLWLPGFFAELPWSWETLTRSMFGHLMPGFVAVWKAVASIDVLSWPLVGVIMVVIHVLLFVGTVRLLSALHGRRRWVPVIALAASLSLSILSCAIWWGATLAPGVGAVAAVWLWDSTIRYLRNRSWPRLLAVFLTMTVAMSFGERQVLTPVYLLGFVLLVGVVPVSTVRERLRLALRGWPAWVTMGVVGTAFIAVYLLGSYREDAGGASAPMSEMLTYLGRSVVDGFLPSVMGVLPGEVPAIFGWIAVAMVVVFVALTAMNSVRTRWVWLWLIGAYLVCQLPIAIGRVGLIGITVAVEMVRYYPEATLLFWIAVSVAIVGGIPRTVRAIGRPALIASAGVVAIATTGMWLWSTVTMSAVSAGGDSRRFFSELVDPDSALSAALDSGEVRMFDVSPPTSVVASGMYPWNLADRIFPWVRPGTELTSIVEDSVMLGRDGSPIEPEFLPVPGAVDFVGEGCVAAGEQPLPVLIGALTPDVVAGAPPPAGFDKELNAMVRLKITADAPSVVRVLSDRPDGSTWPVSNLDTTYPIPAGTSTLVVPVALIDADAVTLRVEEGAPVCVTSADLVRPIYR